MWNIILWMMNTGIKNEGQCSLFQHILYDVAVPSAMGKIAGTGYSVKELHHFKINVLSAK